MTVTGLTPYNISTSTDWQQAILFFLMMIGNLSAVSVTMVWVRRHFFRKKFDAVIRSNAAARKRAHDVEEAHHLERRKNLIRLRKRLGLHHRRQHRTQHGADSPQSPLDLNGKQEHRDGDYSPGFSSSETSSTDRIAEAELKAEKAERDAKKKKQKKGPLRADMIKRTDQPAVLINPMGMPSEGHPSIVPAARSSQDDIPNQANSTGGILNQPNETPQDDNNDASNQPSIRITLPSAHTQRPSAAEAFGDAPPLTESPAHLSWTETRGTGDPLTSPITSRRGPLVEEPDAVDAGDDSIVGPLPRPRSRFENVAAAAEASPSAARRRRTSDPTGADRTHSRRGSETGLNTRFGPTGDSFPLSLPRAANEDRMPRSQTIQYAEPPRIDPQDRIGAAPQPDRGYTTGVFPKAPTGQFGVPRQRTFERTATQYSTGYRGIPLTKTMTSAKDRGFGGFPTPFEIAGKGIQMAFPRARDRFMRSTTMQRSTTIASSHSFQRSGTEGQRAAPYLSFDVNVTGNSLFHSLTETQRDELGGVEYRALDLLAKIVPIYWVAVQLFMITLVAPYCASQAFDKYRPVFEAQGSNAPSTTWFWFFQVVSAYTNTGLSLIDTSMINMADAYMLLIPIAFLILVGNTAFPIFLRFWIWIYSLCLPKNSRSYETVRFILDHPRRCFVYLFPSGQTWFLFVILLFLNCFDWVAFQILDIGNPAIESIPVPQRIFDGLFQSIAVRAAGFQVIGLLSVAPSVQFLYVIMMYISAYPLALSVRSTNVYEERSLGVYTEPPDDQEDAMPQKASSPAGWGGYLAAHARRQLAFDIWWLGFALWLVCIIERAAITDPSTNGWFTVFSCLFELTSAYGTVGLSTGTPTDNFSLSGRFKTLSKLVVIATMLRGRHRGLPVAIDRSILLPTELEEQDAATEAWSVVDPDARSAFREGTMSIDGGGRSTGAATSFTRAATQPLSGMQSSMGINEDAEPRRSASDGDGLIADHQRPESLSGGHALVPTSSMGSIRKSHDSSRPPRSLSSPVLDSHHHHPIVGPAEAFHLDPIQENREGVSTPLAVAEAQSQGGSGAGGILAGGGTLTQSQSGSVDGSTSSANSSAEKGKGRDDGHGQGHEGEEQGFAELYGSASAHLSSSHEH